MPYIGTSPSNGVRRKHTYTATASQTSFSGAGAEGATLSYNDSNFVDVYQNGVKLSEADYTSTSGTAIVLAQGASVSDIVEVVVYDVFSVADTVSKADGGTFDGNVTMAGTLGVTGVLTGTSLDISGDIDVDGTTNLDNTDIDGNLDVTGASNSVVTLIKPQGALPDNSDNAGLYVLHQGTAGTGLRVRTDNALTGSNFAHILVNNASASINAFQVSQYGSGLIAKFDKSGTTAMQIDNSGHVTKPLQSAFLARPSARQANLAINTTHTIVFDSEIFDQNADFSSNTFTAPVTGRYQLNVQLLIQQMDTATDFYYINLKTSNRNYDQYWDNDDKAGDNSNGAGVSIVALADMDAGDTAYIEIIVPNSGAAQMDVETASAFSGYLVA
jgi:hypothetical protein